MSPTQLIPPQSVPGHPAVNSQTPFPKWNATPLNSNRQTYEKLELLVSSFRISQTSVSNRQSNALHPRRVFCVPSAARDLLSPNTRRVPATPFLIAEIWKIRNRCNLLKTKGRRHF